MRVFLEILKEHIINNVNEIYNYAKKPIIAVVKANAYGMGSIEVSSVLERHPKIRAFAVACLEEAIELRDSGIKKPILVLGGFLYKDEISYFKEYNITPVISSDYQYAFIRNEDLDFHLKIDTGMGRLGFFDPPDMSSPRLKGIMTHLASPLDKEYSIYQINKFKSILKALNKNMEIHIQSSAGLLYDIDFTTSVRIGLALYGEKPYEEFIPKIKPIYRFGARLVSLKAFKKGQKISYGGSYTIPKDDTLIGVIAMGYADGVPKQLSNRWFFDFKSQKLPIVGAITMDMTMAEIPQSIDIKIGDTAYFVNENQTFSKASKLLKTIPYELMCRIGKRVKRILL